MHAVTTRLARGAVVLLVAATGLGVVPLAAAPAAAQNCPVPRLCHGGGPTRGGYAASATATALGNGGRAGTPEPCTIDYHWGPGGPEYWWPLEPPVDGHLEVSVTEGLNGTYDVWIHCVENGSSGSPPDHTDWEYDLQGFIFDVEPRDPQDLIEEALASLTVGGPVIETRPGDGAASLVGIDTWLMMEPGSADAPAPVSFTDGLLTVTVSARPADNGRVVWDTGEDPEICDREPVAPGDCFHRYDRSSLGQPGRDAEGRPAYLLTASVEYVGSYVVTLGGSVVASVPELPGITRSSVPYPLAVEEAQALNTSE